MAHTPAIHANVTPESHEAWHQFGALHGVTASGLIAAISEAFNDVDIDLTNQENPANPLPRELIIRARQVDAKRRRRRSGKPMSVKTIHAAISAQAHDRWHNYCSEQGVSVSGLLEAIGELLQNPTPKTTTAFATTITRGRKYDAAARRRHGRKRPATV